MEAYGIRLCLETRWQQRRITFINKKMDGLVTKLRLRYIRTRIAWSQMNKKINLQFKRERKANENWKKKTYEGIIIGKVSIIKLIWCTF